ncbi:hypothetical protein EIP91_011021 [Steccherinum ochraceum]|uniref:Uncharacterized protein n=1 Tax=Steccherinum ochraceum TaxID=92696 RepID=A0A4V2MV24_9APHY|nr:hypothetical protein EIP91_011021 [Steccherinum ochraceum]
MADGMRISAFELRLLASLSRSNINLCSSLHAFSTARRLQMAPLDTLKSSTSQSAKDSKRVQTR